MNERMSELTNGKWVSDEKGSAFFGKKALEILRQCLAHNNRLKDRNAELEAKVKRLTSRGFEDLHDENQQLKATLKAIRELPTVWRSDVGGGTYLRHDYVRDCAEELEALLLEKDDG